MKKAALFLLIFMLILCSSCIDHSDLTSSDLMALIATETELKSGYTYIDAADISSENYISPEMLGYIYYGEMSAPEDLSYAENYCIRISTSATPFELHVYKAKYTSYTDELSRMLTSRGKLLSAPQINPNDSPFFSETELEYEVFCRKQFVFLVAGEDIEEVVRLIKEII